MNPTEAVELLLALFVLGTAVGTVAALTRAT